MKRIFLLLLLLFANITYSQVSESKVFGEYSTPEMLAYIGENKTQEYYWLHKNDMIFMNFPATINGLANLHDKLNYILLLNKLDPKLPSWDKSVFPLGVRSNDSYSNVVEIVAQGDGIVSKGWILGTRELVIFIAKDGYQLRVQEFKSN